MLLLRWQGPFEAQEDKIIEANQKDLQIARKEGLKEALIERLMLSDARIAGMIEGLKALCDLRTGRKRNCDKAT